MVSRAWVVIALAFAAGCPPPAEECVEAPQCIDGTACDLECLADARENAACCDCLAELDCLCDGFVEDTCAEALNNADSVCIVGECSNDDAQCGGPCPFLGLSQ